MESRKINSHAPAGALFSVKPVFSYKNLHSRRFSSWEEAAQASADHLQLPVLHAHTPSFANVHMLLHTCTQVQGFPGLPGCSAVKNPPANARDTGDSGSIPGSGRPSGGRNGKDLTEAEEIKKRWQEYTEEL